MKRVINGWQIIPIDYEIIELVVIILEDLSYRKSP